MAPPDARSASDVESERDYFCQELRYPPSCATQREQFVDILRRHFKAKDLILWLRIVGERVSGASKEEQVRHAADVLARSIEQCTASEFNSRFLKTLNALYTQKLRGARSARVYPFGLLPVSALMRVGIAKCAQYRFEIRLPAPWTVVSELTTPLLTSKIDHTSMPIEIGFQFPSKVAKERGIGPERLRAWLVVLRLYEEPVPGGAVPRYRFARGLKLWSSLTPCSVLLSDTRSAQPRDVTKPCLQSNVLRFSDLPRVRKSYYVVLVEVLDDRPNWSPTVRSAAAIVAELALQAKAEIATEAVTLSLRCPFTLVRLETPMRSMRCKHLQCFELRSWSALWMEKRTPAQFSSRCLICSVQVSLDDFFVDGYSDLCAYMAGFCLKSCTRLMRVWTRWL